LIATQLPDAVAAPTWKVLGAKRVSLGVDRDVIPVGVMPYRFDKIKIGAVLNDIEMFDLAVVYGNGTRDDIQVRRIIRKNSETAPLDLRGDGRNIKRIEMIYRKNAKKGLFTLVTVSGRVA
jgi:hypothetical protein